MPLVSYISVPVKDSRGSDGGNTQYVKLDMSSLPSCVFIAKVCSGTQNFMEGVVESMKTLGMDTT